MRDLSNIQSRMKKDVRSNDIGKIITKLKEDPLVTLEIFTDQDHNLLGIYYQDEVMKKIYNAFPEMLFVDATHKVNELRMPLYVFLICDGNGQSEIVAACLVVNEQRIVIEKMVNAFKKHNSSYTATNVIMTDKDMNERDVLSEAFPSASSQLCLFHVLRTFGREITVEAMSIRSAERSVALDILQKIAYSSTAEKYESNRRLLNDTGFTKVSEYFEANWHPIRCEWVTCFINTFNFNNRTNNRLESINQKIKSVCSAFSDLETFFQDFRTVVSSLRIERDSKALVCTSKVSVFGIGTTVEAQYTRLLTPYAAKFVRRQFEKRSKVKIVDGCVTTAETFLYECSCSFYQSMKLPCKHIFALRESNEQPMFDETLVHKRWRLDNYRTSHVAHNMTADGSCANSSASIIVSTNEMHQPQPKTQHQKYNAAQILALRIATLVSETGISEFNNKMSILNSILQLWENGKSICVIRKDAAAADELLEEQMSDCEDTKCFHEENSEPSSDDGGSDFSEEHNRLTMETVELPEYLETGTSQEVSQITVGKVKSFEEFEVIDDDDYNEAVTNFAKEEENQEISLSMVKVPPRMRKRGRPKGLANTVIGLPRKKAKFGPVAFEKMLPQQRDKVIMTWFVGKDAAEEAMKGKIITEDVVETIPENVNNACIDDCVCMQSVKRFFTQDAWETVEAIIKIKQEGCSYFCTVCELEIDDDQDESINCSSCLGWLHFKCTGLRSSPKKKYWFCRACSTLTQSNYNH